MSDMHTDGNGVAGLLIEAMASDITSAMRTCQDCGEAWAIGAHPAYHAAGVVLRCPGCGVVAMRVAENGDHRMVELRGVLRRL